MSDLVSTVARLPHGYTAYFRLRTGPVVDVQWSPDVPRFHSSRHRRKFLEAYQLARQDFMRQVATVIGGKFAVLDTDGSNVLGVDVASPLAKH
jgi:hypothetical protein